jgi:hypothetical protein
MFILTYLVGTDETLHTDIDGGKETWCSATAPEEDTSVMNVDAPGAEHISTPPDARLTTTRPIGVKGTGCMCNITIED